MSFFLYFNLNSECVSRNIESVDFAVEKGEKRPYYQEVHELFTSEYKPSLSKKSKNKNRQLAAIVSHPYRDGRRLPRAADGFRSQSKIAAQESRNLHGPFPSM